MPPSLREVGPRQRWMRLFTFPFGGRGTAPAVDEALIPSLEWYTLSRVDKHPKIWYIKEQKGRKKNVNLQQRIQTRSAPVVG